MTTLSNTQLQHLDALLQQEGGAPIFAVHGLLTALNCYPHIMPVEDWLPILWGEERSFDNWQEMAGLFATLGQLNQMVIENKKFIPLVDYNTHSTFDFTQFNEEQKEHCLQWCAGFIQGLSCDMAFWTEDSNEAILGSVMALSAIAEQCKDFLSDDEEEDDDEDYEDEDLEEISDEDFNDDEEFDFEIEEEDFEEDFFDEAIVLTDAELAETAANIPTFIKILYQHGHATTPKVLEEA